jgi:hypothetical protein
VAAYGGDALHGPSSSIIMPVTGAGSSFAVAVNPPSISMAASQNATVTVSLASISGFADTISLGCVGLPAGINCHFSSLSVALGANATQTAQLTIDSNNPLGGGTTAMNKLPTQRRTELAGFFFPFSLLMGFWVWRMRKRHAGLFSSLVILILTGAALLATGCGGFSQSSAAPGTYTIQVAGVGTNSNVTEYSTITLTITK